MKPLKLSACITREDREERIGEMEQLSARTISKLDECSASIDDGNQDNKAY